MLSKEKMSSFSLYLGGGSLESLRSHESHCAFTEDFQVMIHGLVAWLRPKSLTLVTRDPTFNKLLGLKSNEL